MATRWSSCVLGIVLLCGLTWACGAFVGVPAPPRRQTRPRIGALFLAGGVSAVARGLWLSGRRRPCRRPFRARDFYKDLGVPREASERDIKTAFRKLAKEWHPDVNSEPGAQEKFQQIAAAYDVLSDSQKRRQYDQGESVFADMTSLNLDDLLGEMLRRDRQRPRRGADLQSVLEVPFEVACFGGVEKLHLTRRRGCQACGGDGVQAGKGTTCEKCAGTGVVPQVVNTPLGVMQVQGPCPACQGDGVDPSAKCPSCAGTGLVPETKELSVKVPAGCADGNQLRLRGEGDAGARGGPAGDVYIRLAVGSSDFVRRGSDIFSECEVSVFEALLGTSARVRTIDGEAEIQIPAGTQPASSIRLEQRGVPKLGKKDRGDHLVTIKVTVPSLTSEQRRLLKELQDTEET